MEENSFRRLPKVEAHLSSITFVDAQHGWAVGDSGTILATTNGGHSWDEQAAPTKESLRSVTFVDAQHGWAVGDSGTILATTNGERWDEQTLLTDNPTKEGLMSVTFVDAQHGWAVGDSGTILATTNGGHSWGKQNAPTIKRLTSVTFVDARHGWAVGDSGTILVTTNGERWEQAEMTDVPTKEGLMSVTFVDAQHGWTVGDSGTILVTTNGGHSWDKQKSPTKEGLRSVTFVDAQHGWAVGDSGTILATTNGGQSWDEQIALTKESLRSVTFVDAQYGWAVGNSGTILATTNGGKSWGEQTAPTKERLTSVIFVDTQHGWAVGDSGTILATTNGGKSWDKQKSPTKEGLRSVTFVDAQHGWAVGDSSAVGFSGTILATINSGKSWSEDPELQSLTSVTFVDAQHGWAVSDQGMILATTNGGHWVIQTVPASLAYRLGFVTFVDAQHGWAVGYIDVEGIISSTILATTNGGKSWDKQKSPTTELLESVTFVNAQHGWAVGESGTILATINGGQSWDEQIAPTKESLTSVTFVDAQHGWAVGIRGTILATTNGGKNWLVQDPFPYRVYPPLVLWVFGVLGLLGLVASWIWPRRNSANNKIGSIVEAAISDRPLEHAAQAPRWMVRLVDGVANYLGNPSTTAPVTLAITGRWGQGKSSVMGLLKGELTQRGHRPVWFNAWHHQETDNVLAALLGTIREQAIPPLLAFPAHPPFLAFDGIVYRARLAGRRALRLWMRVLILHVLLVFAATWLWHHSVDLSNLMKLLETSNGWKEGLFTALALGVGAAPVVKLLQLLRAFGVDPSKLLSQGGGERKASELEAINVFRTRFAVEFGEVTAALGKEQRMVIFIDDLDRCTPSHLLKVLEATNFLNSSGECFIVLGMQRESVLAGLREALEDAQLGPDKDPERWLEKLIQIEVGIPSDDRMLKLLSEQEDTESDSAANSVRRFARKRKGVLGMVGIMVLSGLMAGGFLLGKTIKLPLASEPPPAKPYILDVELPIQAVAAKSASDGTAVSVPPPAEQKLRLIGTYNEAERKISLTLAEGTPPAGKGGSTTDDKKSDNSQKSKSESTPPAGKSESTTDDKKSDNSQKSKSGRGGVTPGITEPTNRRQIAWGLIGLGFIGVVLLIIALNRRYRSETPTDSAAYRNAIHAWNDLIVKACQTPREVKRLLNRMRFDAMLVRSLQPEPIKGTSAEVDPVKKQETNTEGTSTEVDPVEKQEANIVTLAVLEKLGISLEQTATQFQIPLTPELEALKQQAVKAYASDHTLSVFRNYKESIRVDGDPKRGANPGWYSQL